MKNNKLQKLIQQGTSETVELLEAIQIDRLATILSSFLNHKGGNLIVGVNDQLNIKGIDPTISINDLRSKLTNAITPEAPIEIIKEEIENKTVFILKVSEGTKQPYVCNDAIYIRKGSKTVKASTEDIALLIKNRQKDELHWERQVSFGVDEEDLDVDLIKKVMMTAQQNGRSSYQGADYLEFLNHYGLFNNGSFTNACVVLFAKNASKYFPQTRVRLTEYQKNKTDKGLLRDDIIEGNLFEIRERLENYIMNMGTRSTFAENEWRRIDFKYPNKALQEGIINALIHRDYSRFNSHLTISVYPDSFVIANSGQLPDELKVSDLKKNHRSFPTNPDIAHIIFLMGYIDKLGRGTMKILEECKELGLKEPKWTNTKNEVILSFFGPDLKQDVFIPSISDQVSDAVNDAVREILNDAVSDAVSDAVRNRLINIMNLLYANESLTLKSLVATLNSSRATIQRDLTLLNAVNLLKLQGSDKYRTYSVSDALKNKFDALNK